MSLSYSPVVTSATIVTVASLNFDIKGTDSPRTLGVIDTSLYGTGELFADRILTVWLPGMRTSTNMVLVKDQLNIFNSNHMGLTNATLFSELIDLPDGVYKARFAVTPLASNYTEKSFLRVERLWCRFERAVLSLHLDRCEEPCMRNNKLKMEKLKEIEFLILSAVAESNNCNMDGALHMYRIAQRELDKIIAD